VVTGPLVAAEPVAAARWGRFTSRCKAPLGGAGDNRNWALGRVRPDVTTETVDCRFKGVGRLPRRAQNVVGPTASDVAVGLGLPVTDQVVWTFAHGTRSHP